MVIFFLGVRTDGQTDRVLESSYGNMSAHKKFQLKTQNSWLAVDSYMPPRRTGMHNKYQYRFSIGFALKFNIGIGTGIGSNFGIGTSLLIITNPLPGKYVICCCKDGVAAYKTP